MTPAARLSAAIEILDAVTGGRMAADVALKTWSKGHRFAGSGDRRAIAGQVYASLRGRARASWRMGADNGRALVLGDLATGAEADTIAALFTGEGHAPAPLNPDETVRLAADLGPAPDWVEAGVAPFAAERLKARFGTDWIEEARALALDRAPVDLRVNALCGPVDKALSLLAHEDVRPEPTPFSALGLRLPPQFATDVQTTRAFTSGWIEVQDEGSQIASALVGARPGMTVVDYCAGGGGKTLALAAAMKNEGRLIASDTNPKRLQAMRPRLDRATARAEMRRLVNETDVMADLDGQADRVLVDAPCSGSGTWRRHPEAAWRLDAASIDRLALLQGAILARAARLVRPGGRLAYVTCSVLAVENDDVAAAFAAAHADFSPLPITRAAATPAITDAGRARLAALSAGGHSVQLTPRRAGTDGFFVALFERTA